MKNTYNWPLWHWHFELTSACTLKCPRCSRTELPDSLVVDSLDLDFFIKNFPLSVINQMSRVSFCGYDGDPIYNKQFIEICEYFKKSNPKLELYIVTNGSYKKSDWWTKLATVLNQYDQIHFSIDGHDNDTNNLYRVNSDWDSIMQGVDALCGSEVRMIWDLIYFDFNYKHIEKIMQDAKQKGFDAIRFTKSNKFNFFYQHYSKELQPPKEYISTSGRFESKTVKLSDRTIYDNSFANAKRIYNKMDKTSSIIPLCSIGTKGLFVDSQGYFYPCCWITNRYNSEHHAAWVTDDKNIKKTGLEQVLNNPYWKKFKKEISSNSICKAKCNAREVTTETVVRW